MCGLTGILLGVSERTKCDIDGIAQLFSRLLILSEHRGPYATGAAFVTSVGDLHVEKAPLPAHKFVTTTGYHRLRKQLNAETKVLMGHTRWPTQGSHYDNNNNQPLVDASVALTHNGHIPDVSSIFRHFKLKREWTVDSEIILRLASRHYKNSQTPVSSLLHDLSCCPGNLAAVLLNTTNSDEVIFIRRDRPLYTAFHPDRQILLYASEIAIIWQAIEVASEWNIRTLPSNSAWVFSCNCLGSPVAISL